MEKFKISITKRVLLDNSTVYFVYTNRGKEYLLKFMNSLTSSNEWLFDLPENSKRVLFFKNENVQFPADYLLELCRAQLIVRYGITDIEVAYTVEAKRLLKIK